MGTTSAVKRVEVKKAGGLIIQNRRLLVERSRGKTLFNTPGGKLETGETYTETLQRELYEETGLTVDIRHMHRFGSFCAPMDDGTNRIIQIATFIISNWTGEPVPSSEVEQLIWVNSRTLLELSTSLREFTIPKLKQRNLID